jgi:DNA-binding transcriptional ArsR family regulator
MKFTVTITLDAATLGHALEALNEHPHVLFDDLSIVPINEPKPKPTPKRGPKPAKRALPPRAILVLDYLKDGPKLYSMIASALRREKYSGKATGSLLSDLRKRNLAEPLGDGRWRLTGETP